MSRLAGVMPTFQKMHEIKEGDDLREMDSQQLVQHGRGMMNQTDKSVSRSKKIVHETIEMGAVTAGEAQRTNAKTGRNHGRVGRASVFGSKIVESCSRYYERVSHG